jgi:DnaK suppressor protein
MSLSITDAERLLSSRRRAIAGNAGNRPPYAAGWQPSGGAAELSEIDAALARIADGTYGSCEQCGGAIGRDRLRALPEVRRCLACSS